MSRGTRPTPGASRTRATLSALLDLVLHLPDFGRLTKVYDLWDIKGVLHNLLKLYLFGVKDCGISGYDPSLTLASLSGAMFLGSLQVYTGVDLRDG